jgi:hypothetical protein
MDLVVVLNEFASVFREIADKDYISARSNYRLRLREQFFWAGLQALEKYLKAILLFNEKKVRNYRNHDLSALSKAVQGIPWIDFQWPSTLDKTLKRFRDLGDNRYLNTDTYVRPENLAELDEGVWHIRRYCQYVRVTARLGSIDLTQHYVSGINSPANYKRARKYRPFLGSACLEEVLASPQGDPARRALVWNNRFFGTGRVRPAATLYWSSQVPPNRRPWFTPAIKKAVEAYIYFPKNRKDLFLF